MQGKSHDPVALAVPSVTGESWHSPLLGGVRIPCCHTHWAAVRAAVRARPSTLQEQPHPPTWRHAGRRGGPGRPAAARIPSRELASALCSARHPPSEAWASWGMFVGKEEGGFCSHRLQALAALGSVPGLLGSWLWNRGPLGLPGQTQPTELRLPFLSSASPFRCPGQEAAPACQLLPLHFLGAYSTRPDSQQEFLGWARKQRDPDL